MYTTLVTKLVKGFLNSLKVRNMFDGRCVSYINLLWTFHTQYVQTDETLYKIIVFKIRTCLLLIYCFAPDYPYINYVHSLIDDQGQNMSKSFKIKNSLLANNTIYSTAFKEASLFKVGYMVSQQPWRRHI